jgi:hypothetical protein
MVQGIEVRTNPFGGNGVLAPENLIDRDAYAVFTIERHVVLIWKKPPTLAGVLDCRRVFELMCKRSDARFGYLAVVEPSAGTSMPAEVRTALSKLVKEYERSIAAAAIVFEETGFGASIVRSVVSAINLATRIEYPSKVESSIGRAGVWLTLQPRLGKTIAAAQLTTSVNTYRSRWNSAAAAQANARPS